MDASNLDFDLPEKLVATTPVEPRDNARLMVCWRSDPERVEHRVFRELPLLLEGGDRLVFNTTAVAPARLLGSRADSGGKVEGLYLSDCDSSEGGVWSLRWRVLLKSNGKLRAGVRVELGAGAVIELLERERDAWIVGVEGDASHGSRCDTMSVLSAVGATPLPPYIIRARIDGGEAIEDGVDRDWYQTVYADLARRGSVAAPTAGLHFTNAGIDVLLGMGVERTDVLLHVGAGTFRPIDEGDVSDHVMHSEAIEVSSDACNQIAQTRAEGGRVVMVGTTSVRACESVAQVGGDAVRRGFAGPTDLYIRPGYDFQMTDGLITNFHLPRSTLLLLVAGLLEDGGPQGSGIDRLLHLYHDAIEHGYRFYSYGDAMLILP